MTMNKKDCVLRVCDLNFSLECVCAPCDRRPSTISTPCQCVAVYVCAFNVLNVHSLSSLFFSHTSAFAWRSLTHLFILKHHSCRFCAYIKMYNEIFLLDKWYTQKSAKTLSRKKNFFQNTFIFARTFTSHIFDLLLSFVDTSAAAAVVAATDVLQFSIKNNTSTQIHAHKSIQGCFSVESGSL